MYIGVIHLLHELWQRSEGYHFRHGAGHKAYTDVEMNIKGLSTADV